jgi:uncharacterized membrane protein
MNEAMNNWTIQLIGVFGIAAVTVAVFWSAEGIGEAAVAGAILLAFIAVVHFGRRRSDTLAVLGGVGDERTRTLYTRSVAIVGTVMSVVLPGWWLVTVAIGEPNETLNILCAIFGACFIVTVAIVARRG